ncbi:MAG: hypothetical protein EZS28_018012 [Streblomastix strix]|uniref:PARP catalytic domain-containing protein n=1 Tax=Streblomastix strix TaxID=222440 RepID=A0A5J4VVR2_9EUKA|nr:MAG: hypothetical protein EZS28_018012 [Streblomastix strix]
MIQKYKQNKKNRKEQQNKHYKKNWKDKRNYIAQEIANQRKTPENIITGYHQTSAQAAQAILATGFRVGAGGIAGGGIYFALKKEDTNWKAHQKGVILKCQVDVGSCKIMTQMEPRLTGEDLKKQGFDSVYFPANYMNVGLNYPEYVIYNPSRIKKIEYA